MKFTLEHRNFFGAIEGAYSKVTEREVFDSQITLSRKESELAIKFFGKENIHSGKVQSDPIASGKSFFLYPKNEQIELNLVFPKPDRTELRLYLKKQYFRPSSGQIWFVFIALDEQKICLGAMDEADWNRIGQGSEDIPLIHKSNESFSIRPAGRHILTIGRDLIQDPYAAIIELVKNAYDADSPRVDISFNVPKDRDKIEIIIKDYGHGMDRNTVITKWLVPSTDDKLKRRTSPNGRVMQGRKGIGRYAASFLGHDLWLETVSESGERTEVYIDWSAFDKAKYLDDVPILVDSVDTEESSGTTLTITGDQEYVSNWLTFDKSSEADEIKYKTSKPFERLQHELKKLIPPIDSSLFHDKVKDEFSIFVTVDGYINGDKEYNRIKIESYPIFDLFDYRISGIIESNGENTLKFENQRARNTVIEEFKIDVGNSTTCGQLVFDLRVYDKDATAIDLLIQRGLKDGRGNYLSKSEARQLLKEYNGVGVYRGGFRIRPLGDPGFDWLELDRKRVQNPGRRIGSDRVIGYIEVQSEEQSGLEEKSGRDGLRDNRPYEKLKEITKAVIGQIEQRRYRFLQDIGLNKRATKVDRDLDKIFNLGGLKTKVERKLEDSGIQEDAKIDVLETITEQETASNKIVEDIRQAVAIYQGQATLGRIVNVVLHEGRGPVNFLRSQSDNAKYWLTEYEKSSEPDLLTEAIFLVSQFEPNAKLLSDLFGRIDPLAARRSARKSRFQLKECIERSFLVFEDTLIKERIDTKIHCDDDISFFGWPVDIQIILTNLIDNSIFWITEKKSKTRRIEVSVENQASEFLYLDYRDTGPGIEPSLIEDEVIFDPEFSTKPDGTGLGLAIAGESATRNGLDLKAFESEDGAYFRLSTIEDNAE